MTRARARRQLGVTQAAVEQRRLDRDAEGGDAAVGDRLVVAFGVPVLRLAGEARPIGGARRVDARPGGAQVGGRGLRRGRALERAGARSPRPRAVQRPRRWRRAARRRRAGQGAARSHPTVQHLNRAVNGILISVHCSGSERRSPDPPGRQRGRQHSLCALREPRLPRPVARYRVGSAEPCRSGDPRSTGAPDVAWTAVAVRRYPRAMPLHIGIVACSAEGAALCYRTICAEGAGLLGAARAPRSVAAHALARRLRGVPRSRRLGGRRRADARRRRRSSRRPAPTS